ncbi:MAG: FAD-dependent oxidoreductase [Microlunatus sp.]|nr:FAD-dependent oxidoreductase [Microlunatus sp.]
MSRDRVVVVGAGLAGVICAQTLRRAGVPVAVLDRGRRIGGRMATRRVDRRPVDLGASYLTAADPGVVAVVEDWRRRGLARPWTDTFAVAGSPATTGPLRWGTPFGLRSLVEDLAEGLEVTSGITVDSVRRHGDGWLVGDRPARAVVLAMPDPQAHRLLDESTRVDLPTAAEFEPVLALVATWPDRTWDFDGLFVNDHPVLAWVADDGRRRGDDAPVLVAHSTPGFAAGHLDDPAAAKHALIRALSEVVGVPAPTATLIHRWTFARPSGARPQPYALTDHQLGLCGDGWAEKPRVEAAFLSGQSLGQALADRLDL